MIRTVLILASLLAANLFAANIKGMRFWQSPDSTRVVVDLTGPAEHSIFTLKDPDRMVIDLKGAALSFDPADLDIKSSLVQHVRTSEKDNSVRVVLDLKRTVSFKSFELEPYQSYGHRLVVDLLDESNQEEPPKPKAATTTGKRDIVVAIDAGHGGDDPGAVGAKGTLEKTIALSVAKELAKKVDATPGMKAVLVRKGDYFINLRKRTQIARQNQADIFVSIHADGFHDKRARGSSVWVVSPKGAESEMGRWLEQRENESDLLGGVESLSNKDPLLAKVLLDLSTSYSVSASLDAATHVHHKMARVAPKMHKKRVERAAFVVLKMPDIPAMLVELAFISNPQEEKLLRSSSHRQKLANAIYDGLHVYFKDNPPDGTLFASQRKKPTHYTIKSGDTLSGIASRFNLSIAELKQLNKLNGDDIRIGQRLKLTR
ncbi:N-acetylmuramoyl-L-alanine amidase [Pleionea litopenaei]|uniref:N-acetylmuramoyl-L-alanine amidase AmiC n=1 Tax=Pleionea litopenaei TaxID=3070815 RepID=A0AA51X8H6_9GAMM|nr:N-acetylmuramoyl-L-alanine amidase [Pleionea sp. HL-JVS1]WMS88991.1 N-acetylmuramoyl-L-alanine amidase [Pleionea sp. HL-JVS1]